MSSTSYAALRLDPIVRIPLIVKDNKSLNLVWSKWGSQIWSSSICCYLPLVEWLLGHWGILKHFLQSRCIFILYLSLVVRKVAEFYHNIDRRSWLVWVLMTYFHRFFWTIPSVLTTTVHRSTNWAIEGCVPLQATSPDQMPTWALPEWPWVLEG